MPVAETDPAPLMPTCTVPAAIAGAAVATNSAMKHTTRRLAIDTRAASLGLGIAQGNRPDLAKPLGAAWLNPAVQPAGPSRPFRPLRAGVLQQPGGPHVAPEVGGVHDLAAQRLVQLLGLAQRERLRKQRERLAHEPHLVRH